MAIEATGICYAASREFAIRDLKLQVPDGALYGFLGPNGCGKTTSIRLLLGLLRPDRGQVRLLGHSLPDQLPAALARIGVVPDRPHLHRYLKVGDAVDFHAAFYPTWDARWARELMGEFQLLPGQKVARLSKGETARLMLLLALCQLPDLLVLDEPMDGLDPVVRRDVLTALLDYVSRRHATVFVSSHLVHELERFCDWVGVMDRGRLVVEMPMAEFKEGTKRIRLAGTSALAPSGAPFTLLASEPDPCGGTTWVVRGWRREMGDWLGARGLTVRDVSDLDLEDGFVELLRAFRAQAA